MHTSKNHVRLCFALLLSVASLGVVSGNADAQRGARAEESELYRTHLAAVRELYESASWPKGVRRAGIPLASLVLDGWSGGELTASNGRIERVFVSAEGDVLREGAPVFTVQAYVSESAEEANETLVRWLGGLSSMAAAPSARAYGYALGDVGYVGPAGREAKAYSWVAFVRGNVAVRLLSADTVAYADLDLPGIAMRIDAIVGGGAELRVGALPRPTVELEAAETDVVAGAVVPLRVGVVDPAGAEGTTLQWHVLGEGQGYVEERSGGWFLFTTGGGDVTVELEVIGAMGVSTARTVDLQVADD